MGVHMCMFMDLFFKCENVAPHAYHRVFTEQYIYLVAMGQWQPFVQSSMLQMGLLDVCAFTKEEGDWAIVVTFDLQIYKKEKDLFSTLITTTSKLVFSLLVRKECNFLILHSLVSNSFFLRLEFLHPK